jgi:hypothetical protein
VKDTKPKQANVLLGIFGEAGRARTDDPQMVWITQVPSGYKNVMFANAFSDRKKLSFSS